MYYPTICLYFSYFLFLILCFQYMFFLFLPTQVLFFRIMRSFLHNSNNFYEISYQHLLHNTFGEHKQQKKHFSRSHLDTAERITMKKRRSFGDSPSLRRLSLDYLNSGIPYWYLICKAQRVSADARIFLSLPSQMLQRVSLLFLGMV